MQKLHLLGRGENNSKVKSLENVSNLKKAILEKKGRTIRGTKSLFQEEWSHIDKWEEMKSIKDGVG